MARRLNTEITLSALVGPVWGVVAAMTLWRFAVQRWEPAAAAVLTAGAIAVTWQLVRRRLVTLGQAAVIADRRSQAGGLLLTRLETPIGPWESALEDRIERLTPPPIAIARPLAAILLGLSFLAVAMWIPLPPHADRPPNAAAASRVDELAQELEAASKEEPIEAEARKELERLREEVKQGTFDAADWEAADSLGKELEHKAEEADKELLKAEEATSNLAAAMESGRTLERLDREREQLEQALMQLSDGKAQNPDEAFEQAFQHSGPAPNQADVPANGQQHGETAPDQLRPQTGQPENWQAQNGKEQNGQPQSGDRHDGQLASGKQQKGHEPANAQPSSGQSPSEGERGEKGNAPTRAQLDELKRALEQRRAQLNQSFGRGGERAASASRAHPSGHGRSKPTAGGENQQESGGEDGTGEGKLTRTEQIAEGPHASHLMKGSAAHGPGEDTNLIFGGRADMDPARLKMKALPEGNGGEGTELLGLVAADPTRSAGGKITAGSGKGAEGEETPANREGGYLPRNKSLIQRYFDSPKARNP